MRRSKVPVLLAIAVTTVVTGFVALPADAAVACSITAAPTKVVVALEVNRVSLVPTTSCPDGSAVEFGYRTTWPEGVPSATQAPGYRMKTYFNGDPKALSTEGDYPFGIDPAAGNVLAGQPMQASYTAFVDEDKDNIKDAGETAFTYDTTLTILRATRITDFSTSSTGAALGSTVSFSATAQRADWETESWRTINAWSLFDVQFKAEGTDQWTTVAEKRGGFTEIEAPFTGAGDFRVKYRGDVVSGVSYSDPVHIGVA